MKGPMKKLVEVAKTTDIPAGEVRSFEVEGLPIAVCNLDGRFCAVEDRCTHDDGPLGEGRLDGPEIECPRHGARFDVRTGEVLALPAFIPIKTYPIRIDGDRLSVEIGD
jgi:3-phenylpropionate/trans-cinnamate dioxygenase ferredoxin component